MTSESARSSLAVGIVLYENSEEELGRLSQSVRIAAARALIRPTVWIFDNSVTPLEAMAGRFFPDAVYRTVRENLGFGRAHNRLMREAFARPEVGSYLCLNPDATLHPQCLVELLRAVTSDRVGLVEALQFPEEHSKAYDPLTGDTSWCSGCALLITRPLWTEIGGFDESFFMYCEDVDLSWRARAAGFKTRVAPRAIVHHFWRDRQQSPRMRLGLLRSGAVLAAKYEDETFLRTCLHAYERAGGEPFEVPRFERPPATLKAQANFLDGFAMGPGRW